MSITHFGAFILGYELVAKLAGRPTWTDLTARRSVLAAPIVVFSIWLAVHLLRATEAKEFTR